MRNGHDATRQPACSWTRGAARVLGSGALALLLTASPLVAAAPAARADATPGKVTINLPAASQRHGHTTNANDAGKVRYHAYRVFSGDVGLDATEPGAREVAKNEITNVAWESPAMRAAVTGFIESRDTAYEDPADATESALKAAEFIANHIGANGEAASGKPSQDPTLQLESRQFGSGLVAAIRGAGAIEPTPALDKTVDLEPGRAYGFDDGWYLFATSTASVRDKDDSRSGTSPIFAVVGGDEVTVTEKATVPTVDKRVRDDSRDGDADADWGMAADAHAGQDLSYRLIGTVADNIRSYDSYFYRFTDTLGEGLAFNARSGKGNANGDAHVYLHKAHDPKEQSAEVGDRSCEVTENFDFAVSSSGVMTAEAPDLRRLAVAGEAGGSYEMVAGDYLTVEYTARLVPGSTADVPVQGSTGNRNEAKVTYSNNPKTDSRGSSYGQEARVYTYSLRLHKQDKQNASRSLHGAKFTLQVAKGDDAGSDGKYVQADGSLAESPHEFETDAGGDILVRNLDAGTYTLVETSAPPAEQASGNPDDAYELLDPATVQIGSNVHETSAVDGTAYGHGDIRAQEAGLQVLEMSAVASAPSGFGHGSLIDRADSVDASGAAVGSGLHPAPAAGSGAQAADATVNLVVREAKETQMPLAGGAGIAAFAVVGAAAVAAGAALLARRRAGDAGPRKH